MPEPVLKARPDGLVESEQAVVLPIMAPRLQGELSATGSADLALWGEGDLGRLRFTSLDGPYVYGPNSLSTATGAVHVAQEAPVMVICGATPDSGIPKPSQPGSSFVAEASRSSDSMLGITFPFSIK